MSANRRFLEILALLRCSSWPTVRKHPRRAALVIVAVAIGAGAVVATGSLVESSLASFEAGIRRVAGDADLRVSNGFVGIPEDSIATVAEVPGVEAAGGILTSSARLAIGDHSTRLLLVGVDLLGEDPVHHRVFSPEATEVEDETVFVTRLDAIVLPRRWAQSHGIALGDPLSLDTRAGRRTVYALGLLDSSVSDSGAVGAIGIMDLPALQHLLGREGLIDAVDVSLRKGTDVDAATARVQAAIGGIGTVSAIGRGRNDVRNLLFNLELILHIAGLIAIVVSALIIFHAVSLISSARTVEIDTLRTVGASRRAVLAMMLVEAAALGLVGGAIGLGIGSALAWLAQGLFSASVETLYTDFAAQTFRISPRYLLIGLGLAVSTTLIAALAATSGKTGLGTANLYASPRAQRLTRSRRLAALGAVCAVASLVATLGQRPDLSVGTLIVLVTIADVLLLAGLALTSPLILWVVADPVLRLLRRVPSRVARIAWQGLTSDTGRTAALLGSMLVGLAYALITVAVVGSLRSFVFHWVDYSFRADLTVSATGSMGILPSAPPLPASLEQVISRTPGVEHVDPIRVVTQPYGDRWIVIASRDPSSIGTRYPARISAGDLEGAKRAMIRGDGVIVSSHFAEKFGLAPGRRIELRTPSGARSFEIGAVIEDFLADLGTVFIGPETFRRLWRDDSVSGFHVWLAAGVDAGEAREALSRAVHRQCECDVLTGAEFRAGFNRMVNAAFQTAYALEVVAVVVLVISVASFYALTLRERSREIRVLRSVGASRFQLIRCFLLEAGILGVLGGALGCIAGIGVSYRLVHTTMHASGGLNIPYVLPLWTLPAIVAAAVVLSLLSSAPPILRATRPRAIGLLQIFDE